MTTPKPFVALELGQYFTKARCEAMREGIRVLGGSTVHLKQCTLPNLALALASHRPKFCFTTGMHPAESAARGYLRGLGLPLVVLDCGYFKRSQGSEDELGYNQVGLDRLNWIPPIPVNGERWHALEMGPLMQPRKDRPKKALILGQVPNDSQHGLDGKQLGRWLTEAAAYAAARGFDLVYRPHPSAGNFRFDIHVPLSPAKSLESALDDCALVICYNSTAGLAAIQAGVPVLCHHTAHYAEIASYGLAERGCGPVAVMTHFYKLSYAQWNCAEIAQGKCLQFLSQCADILP